jgi:hypothetical protein
MSERRHAALVNRTQKEVDMEGMFALAMVQWGFLTAVIARGKRRNAALWFLLGAVLPVVGIVVALAVDTAPRQRPAPKRRQPATLAPPWRIASTHSAS